MKKLKGQKYTKEEALKVVSDCYDKGEPVFIIQGHDYIASNVVKEYAERQKNAAGPDNPESPGYKLAESTERYAEEILRWQLNNMEKMELAD